MDIREELALQVDCDSEAHAECDSDAATVADTSLAFRALATIRDLDAKIERLQAANEALRKDAERYRWVNSQRGYVLHSNPRANNHDIDAALAARRE